ncbi:MAG TPA: metal-dependent transcriptional regulator [Methanoregulaceae archaeon]|nr:metal-dependent transcriptional regulator [Methanoregulaceae archaeon]
MQPSSREDYLEAIYKYHQEKCKAPRISELGSFMGKPDEEVESILAVLKSAGDLELHEDEILLTPRGMDMGRRIMRKHQILECFFTEMLGMEPRIASSEACVLEHDVSDETIDRLGRYITNPYTSGTFSCKRRIRAGWTCTSILDFPEGAELIVRSVSCGGNYHRLADLGIFPGEKIILVRKLNNKAVVIRAKGCDIALSPEIAGFIIVEQSE